MRWKPPPPPRRQAGWVAVIAGIVCNYINGLIIGGHGHWFLSNGERIHTDPWDAWYLKPSTEPGLPYHPNILPGSAELDLVCGLDCNLSPEEWGLFTTHVLGEHLGVIAPNRALYTNLVFGDIYVAANINWKIKNNCLEPQDLFWLMVSLARFTITVIGMVALTPAIWDTVFSEFFDGESSARAYRRATSLIGCSRNIVHTMLCDTKLNRNGQPPLQQDLLNSLPAPHRRIIELLRDERSTTRIREAVPRGEEAANILMQRLLGEGLTFEEWCARWYRDGLTTCNKNDETGLVNGILRAYGYVEKGDTMESLNTPVKTSSSA